MLRYFYKNTHVSFTVNKLRYSSQVIKVCRQSRKTFLLLYCLFFIFIIIFLFLSHYLRSAISLPFFVGSFSYLASW